MRIARPLINGFLFMSQSPFIATQLNSTRHRVELSCVAINGPLVACVTYLHNDK